MGKIGIIDYGMGNLTSIINSLNFIGADSKVVRDIKDLNKYDKFILPGVGAFKNAMDNLKSLHLIDEIYNEVLIKKKPVLGLCLGMQLLFENSVEHGLNEGLSLIKGNVLSLRDQNLEVNVPHMGWNNILPKTENLLLEGILDLNFYFVHSFFCKCKDEKDALATVDYGVEMDVVIQKDHIFGCQFHPEKSQKSGLQLLTNFYKL